MFVDIHTHIDHPMMTRKIGDVVSRASAANVVAIINNGTDPKSNRHVLELAKQHDIIKAAVGIYPTEAPNIDVDEEIKWMKAHKDKFIALGECGLDYKLTEDRTLQKNVFESLIKFSEQLKKPIIVHSRKAETDVIDCFESANQKKVIFHCFCGNKKLVKRIVDNGWYLTIPTNVVRSEQFQANIERVPLKQLFTETDAPFLSPFKDQMNEPAFVVESAKKIAEIKGMDVNEVARIIYNNYQRVFL